MAINSGRRESDSAIRSHDPRFEIGRLDNLK